MDPKNQSQTAKLLMTIFAQMNNVTHGLKTESVMIQIMWTICSICAMLHVRM
jgi:hypothetical protein